MEEQLLEWISRFSYPAVFVLLSATGIGLPISEDVVLLAGGTVCSTGHALVWVMLPIAWAGVLTADTLLFRIGRRLGPKVIEHKRLQRVLTPERVAKVRGRFARWGAWTIFIARFLPGVRMPTFLLSGSMGVSQQRFWLADGCAAGIFSSVLVLLGWRYGAVSLPYVRAFGGYGLLLIGAALLAALVVSRLRR